MLILFTVTRQYFDGMPKKCRRGLVGFIGKATGQNGPPGAATATTAIYQQVNETFLY
jgi:hypothetical protein